MPRLDEYSYVFAIGTFFALLDAYNNGANDVANSWATSVSSRSITYRWAMLLAIVFEMVGATTVGARTADTIKNEIIPIEAFQGNAGVQMLAFTCALAGASSWVMWCTRHSAHVSSTYSLISAVAGVGVATAGAAQVNWGWNGGQGLGAIFSGLILAPACSGCFASIIFLLIKTIVHMRTNPVPWAVYTSPFFFLIAGTVCTLSIVYKGSPNLGLDERPGWWIAAVTVGTGAALATAATIFFVPFVYAKVINKDYTVRWYHMIQGPMLLYRHPPPDAETARVPDYAVMQHDDHDHSAKSRKSGSDTASDEKVNADFKTDETMIHDPHDLRQGSITVDGKEKALIASEIKPEEQQATYKELMAQGRERFHARLREKRGPLGWAMRYLHDNPRGAGEVYELKNMAIVLKRIPAQIVVALLYGMNYDIHAAQSGISGTPEGERMARVYAYAHKYPNEVEHCYSYIQVITACTASFAHGANDVGNAVGPWAVIYSAWNTGDAAESEAAVPIWQIAVLAATISVGLITYGFNIMKVMGNKITYHSPSRGKRHITCRRMPYTNACHRFFDGNGRCYNGPHVVRKLKGKG